MESSPKKQHIVTRHILENFCNAEGRIFSSTTDSRIRISNPKDVFVKNHIYSRLIEGGMWEYELEKKYRSIENDAGPVLRKILSPIIPVLGSSDVKALIRLLFHQWRRFPEFISQIFGAKTEEEALLEINKILLEGGFPFTDDQLEQLAKKESKEILLKELFVNAMLDESSILLKKFYDNASICVVSCIGVNSKFIIGTNPILTVQKLPELRELGILLFMPISSTIGVGLIKSIQVKHVYIKEDLTRTFCTMLSRQSRYIAGYSENIVSQYLYLVGELIRDVHIFL